MEKIRSKEGRMSDLEQGQQRAETPDSRLPSWNESSHRSTAVSWDATVEDNAARHAPTASQKARQLMGLSSNHDHSEHFRALPYVIRGHIISMLGELIGTFSFLFFAFSATQIAVNANLLSPGLTIESLLYISLTFGFSLAINAWTFFRVSGGLFNPAVNFALCLVGALTWIRGGLLFIAQMIGALIAAGIVSALFPGDLNVDTTLGNSASTAQGFFIEAFATFELILVILMLAAEKHDGRFLAPVGIGLALFIAELSAVPFTGGSLNPARSFAPSAVNRTFPRYHWIYWLGPLVGALAAAMVYKLLKFLEYETANPDSVDPTLSQEDPTVPRRRTGIIDAIKKKATMSSFSAQQETGITSDDDLEDKRDWVRIYSTRMPTGFGDGLISARAQGSTRKGRILPD